MPNRADQFIEALRQLEQGGEAEPIASLFAEGADVSNPLVEHAHEGEGGARAFWTAYRAAFDEIGSEFRNVVEGEDASLLEWVSTGSLKGGEPIRYGGVSVLEYGESGITAFRTYFDTAQLRTTAGGRG